VQAFGKLDVSVQRIPTDLLSATAHKLGGLVGIGLLYCREGVDLAPLTYGGTQERALWPGTQNPLGAVGFARAARLAVKERATVVPRWHELRERLTKRLKEGVRDLTVHASDAPERLPNILSVGIPDCDPGALLVSLDLDGIAVSAGSACSSGSVAASHVLEAMGIAGSDEYATLRYSFGPTTTREHVERAADATIRACSRIMAHT
jgi:cysteine desulfurase